PRRSCDQPAVSQLCRTTPAARVLAQPHDARVLRPLGHVLESLVASRTCQGARQAHTDSCRRSLSVAPERNPGGGAVRDGAAATAPVAPGRCGGAASSRAAARL